MGKALKAAGMDPTQINLADPEVAELIRQGRRPRNSAASPKAPVEEVESPMRWVCVLRRRREKPAKLALAPKVEKPWHETRSRIESKGRELGLGVWDEHAQPSALRRNGQPTRPRCSRRPVCRSKQVRDVILTLDNIANWLRFCQRGGACCGAWAAIQRSRSDGQHRRPWVVRRYVATLWAWRSTACPWSQVRLRALRGAWSASRCSARSRVSASAPTQAAVARPSGTSAAKCVAVKSGWSKLTPGWMQEIRAARREVSHKTLASRYGMSRNGIINIRTVTTLVILAPASSVFAQGRCADRPTESQDRRPRPAGPPRSPSSIQHLKARIHRRAAAVPEPSKLPGIEDAPHAGTGIPGEWWRAQKA